MSRSGEWRTPRTRRSVTRSFPSHVRADEPNEDASPAPAILRERHFAWLRVVLGLLWLTDGLFKWQPGVLSSFLSIVQDSAKDQPGPIHALIQWNAQILAHAPQLADRAVGSCEILIGCLLILGLGSRMVLLGSMAFALAIWVFGEGLGGIFSGAATDIGASPMYLLLALAIYFGQGWQHLSLARGLRAMRVPKDER